MTLVCDEIKARSRSNPTTLCDTSHWIRPKINLEGIADRSPIPKGLPIRAQSRRDCRSKPNPEGIADQSPRLARESPTLGTEREIANALKGLNNERSRRVNRRMKWHGHLARETAGRPSLFGRFSWPRWSWRLASGHFAIGSKICMILYDRRFIFNPFRVYRRCSFFPGLTRSSSTPGFDIESLRDLSEWRALRFVHVSIPMVSPLAGRWKRSFCEVAWASCPCVFRHPRARCPCHFHFFNSLLVNRNSKTSGRSRRVMTLVCNEIKARSRWNPTTLCDTVHWIRPKPNPEGIADQSPIPKGLPIDCLLYTSPSPRD